jgi:hypothetical protein
MEFRKAMQASKDANRQAEMFPYDKPKKEVK